MKCEVVPSEVSKVVPFAPSSYSSLLSKVVENTYGFVSKNGLLVYLVQDTVLNVYHAESGRWCGGHCFAESLNNPSAKISVAVEFFSSHISFPCVLLAINQDNECLLCMFDVSTFTVRRSVLIPDEITSLDVVSEIGGACIETHYFNRKLRYMFGVVAVGTRHGHLFFLDLCLDENFNCDESLPNITTVVRKREFTPEKRVAAISKKQHILLHLNDESTNGSSFEFKNISSSSRQYPNGDVYVTAVKYLSRLASLAVGFSFGGIQLWELHTLTLQYSFSDHHDEAIVKFGFQEPENDPRNFCYLWAVKGHIVGEDTLPTSTSVATLYSLTYHSREHIENFGTLYTELLHCSRKFELPLGSDVYNSMQPSSSFGTRLISCQVINQKDILHGLQPSNANESDAFGDDTSLCYISWEVWADSDNASYHLAVFDLNQWYQAHMPLSFRGSPFELNPYLGIFSIEEIGYNFLEQGVLGVYVIPQTIKKFRPASESEEFFFPSSLEFKLLCFTENEVRKATYLGFQKQLLHRMAELGPQLLMNPKDMFPFLIKSGLVPLNTYNIEHATLSSQKECILQLALEHNFPFFFMKCLKEWRYSDSMHEYCTSKSLLAWVWKRVIFIKSSIDKICVPLFNGSGEDLDKPPLKQLYSFRKQLSLIDRIMAGYQKFVTPRTEQGIQELQCRKDAVSCINLYLQIVLWLRSSQILPENIYVKGTTKPLTYNYEELQASYRIRRSQLEKLGRLIDPSEVLLIDGMVKELGLSNSWLEKNGTELYPPPSIYAAVSCYLLDEVSIEMKHSFMYYFLLDLKHTNQNVPLSQELKKFLVVFGVPQNLMKVVKAFWYLDQKNTLLSIEKLFHSSIKTTDILPWQHNRIIKAFLSWKAPKEALKYINHMEPPQTTMEAMKLHLSILLACGAVTEGWEYQRKKQEAGFGLELMNHFFLGCQEMQMMKDLMYLPLNSLESSSLVKFLSENQDPKAQEYLVIYHLLHCNFFEAMNINERLSKLLMQRYLQWNGTPVEKRTADRGFIVENLMGAVSEIEKCLMQEMKDMPHEFTKKEVLQPISIAIKSEKASKSAVTISKIVRSLIFKDSPCVGKESVASGKRSRALSVEDLPFLRPPLISQSIGSPKELETPRSTNNLVAKRALSSLSPTEYSSPAKRSRLLDNVSFLSPSLKKTPKSLAGDIASLLHTPPIPMHTPNRLVSEPVATPTLKPQSILKNKMKENVKLNFYTCSTPSASEVESSEGENGLDEAGTTEYVFSKPKKDSEDSESLSKQLRFDLPEGEQSVTDVSLHPETPSKTSFSIEVSLKDDSQMQEEDSNNSAKLQVKEILLKVKGTTSNLESDGMEVEPPVTNISPSGSSKGNLKHSFLESSVNRSQVGDSGIFNASNASVFQSTVQITNSIQPSETLLIHKSSSASPRPPLRSDLEVEDSSKSQEVVSCLSSSFVFSAPSVSGSVNRTQLSINESMSEQSDVFYSPCAGENTRTSFVFSEPVSLFPESSTSLESQEALQQPQDKKIYIVPPSNIDMDTSSEDTDVESPIETPKPVKPSQRIFKFSKPSSTESTPKVDAKPQKKKFIFSKETTTLSDSTNQQTQPTSTNKDLPIETKTDYHRETTSETKIIEAPISKTTSVEISASDEDTSDKAPTKASSTSDTFRLPAVPRRPKKKFVFTKIPDSEVRKSSRTSRRTFVFTKIVSPPPVSDNERISQPSDRLSSVETDTVESEVKEGLHLLEKEAETYEEFSKSLAESSTKRLDEDAGSKVLISSPTGVESSFNSTQQSEAKSKGVSSKKKEKSSKTADKGVGATPKTSKKKTKSKTTPKMEFSFAEPHSPADSEILLALAKSPPPPPSASFIFSPPLTRGRLRKKHLDDTLGSSFCSVVSEVSFARPSTPPLESSLMEGKGSKKKSRLSSQSKAAIRKSATKKTRATSEKSVLLSPVRELRGTPTKKSPSPSKDPSLRHSMVLRQTKQK